MEASLIKDNDSTCVDGDHLVGSRESKLEPLTIIIYGATGDPGAL